MNIKTNDPDRGGGVRLEPATLVDLMRTRALGQPDHVAYTFLADKDSEISLTYGDIDRQARAIAASLQERGASGNRVLLLYPPGLDYITAFMGCLYAGAVAVPSYPPRMNRSLLRLQNIIADAQASTVLTTATILARARAHFDQSGLAEHLTWLATDDVETELARHWREPNIDGDTIAFLQYTSGSTSSPKGVMVSHGNILHNQRMIQAAFRQTEDSVIVSWLPLYHDMGLIGTVLQPPYLGAKCVLMSPASFLQHPFRWLEAISQYKATTSGGPNFAYELCVNKIGPAQREMLDLSSWKVAFNGAEPIRADTLERFAEAFAPCGFRPEAFYPCYGLAEATLLVSGGLKSGSPVVKSLQAEGLEARRAIETVPGAKGSRRMVGCGQTLMGQKAIIVNTESLTESSAGEIGEIWVSGQSIAQGYWKRPLETAQHFGAYLTDTGEGPFLRTGDLGFFLDGELFVTGRLKDLIIIRGANYYPQDIELTVERSHAELRAGCGAAFAAEIKGEERLVIVQELEHHHKADNDSIIASIREAVSEAYELQAYAIVLLRAGTIPKTSSGKIQRHACREGFVEGSLNVIAEWKVGAAPPSQAHKPALKTILSSVEAIEAWLAMQFAPKLGIDPFTIDINQPIARYGIDSLASIELMHSIETSLGVNLAITDLLESPTIAQLATHIKDLLTPGSHPRGAVSTFNVASKTALPPSAASVDSVDAGPKLFPLSHSQKSLWFLHQLAPQSTAYNVASAIRIRSELDIAALENAFEALVNRHSSLRTTFTAPDGSPLQRVHSRMKVFFHREDISAWDADAVNARLIEEAYRPFDLEAGPLLRVYLFSHSAEEHILLIAVHHIVVDFWSLAILLHELGQLYKAEKTNAPLELEPLSLQYSDYALWQAEMLASEEGERLRTYWQQQLDGKLPVLNLPTDKPRPNIQTYRGASVPFKLSVEQTQGVKALSQSHNATPFMTLLATFQVMLHRYTNQEDILVGSPMGGRSRADLASLVGYFANPVVLRANLSMNPTFNEFVDQVRHTVLSAFNHQDYPFALLVEQLQTEWDPARAPIFQVMFVLQKAHLLNEKGLASYALGEAGVQMELEDLSLESMALEQQVAQFDLTMIVAETDGVISGALQYNEDLFEEETIRRMAAHYVNILSAVVEDAGQKVCEVGSSRVDLQACKLEYSIVSPK